MVKCVLIQLGSPCLVVKKASILFTAKNVELFGSTLGC